MPALNQPSTKSLHAGSEMKKAVNEINNYELFIDYTQKEKMNDHNKVELPK